MNEQTIFSEAIEISSPEEQSAYLDRVCSDDAVRCRVDRLLALHNQSDLLVDRPAVDAAVSDLRSLEVTTRMGESIGPYKLLEQLGEGGMGVVYMAEQREPVKRKVALKIIKPGMDTKQVLARFESERQALAMMEHANIARVLDVGETAEGRPYFVMELVRGVPITDYCNHENVSIRDRLKLFIEVCRAVQHAHMKGVIHRDIKPSNVMVTINDGDPAVKMIDFGVAKAMNAQLTERTLFTNYAQIIGTPLYMSPEQAELSGLDVDTRSDIYSLGVLLYELLTGTTPFGEDRLREVGYDEMRRIIREEEPQKPSTRVSTLGAELETESDKPGRNVRKRASDLLRGELDWITIKALEKKRDRRYQSSQEFADDVRRYLDNETVQACPPSKLYVFRKFVGRHRGAVLTVTLASVLLLAGTIVSAAYAIRATRAEKKAVTASEVAEQEAEVANAISMFLREDLLRSSLVKGADPGISLQEALDQAAVGIEGQFKKKPLVEAEIRLTLGLAYATLGEVSTADQHLSRARSLLENTLGPSHRDTLKVEFHQAVLQTSYDKRNALSDAQRAIGAIERFKGLLQKQKASLGHGDRDTLVTMGYLALCYSRAERFEEAMTLFDQANTAFAETLPSTDPSAIRCLEQTAASLAAQGRQEEAEAVLENRRRNGHAHGDLTAEDAAAALAEIEALVHSRELALGSRDPRTLEACTRLADALLLCRRVKDAEKLLLRTLQIQAEQWGDDHSQTLATKEKLAGLYFHSSEIEKAAECYKSVLRGSDPNTQTLQYARVVCEMMMFKDKFRESAELRAVLAETQARVHGELDSRPLRSLRDQVVTLALIPDLESLTEVTERLVELVGEDHIDTLHCRMWMGSVLRKLERLDEAEPILQSAYERAKAKPGPDDRLTLQIGTILAMTLDDAGKTGAAEELQRITLAANVKTAGERSRSTFNSVAHLSSICIAQDKLHEANQLLHRAMSIRTHLKEHDHHVINNAGKLVELFVELQAAGFEIDEGAYKATLQEAISAARKKAKADLVEKWSQQLADLEEQG